MRFADGQALCRMALAEWETGSFVLLAVLVAAKDPRLCQFPIKGQVVVESLAWIMNDFIIWEPSALRDSFHVWWMNSFFGINNQHFYGPPSDYPGDWICGGLMFAAMIFGPLLLLDFISRCK